MVFRSLISRTVRPQQSMLLQPKTVQPALRESSACVSFKPTPPAASSCSLKRGLSSVLPSPAVAQGASAAQAKRLAACFSSASRTVPRATSAPIMAFSSNPKVLIPVGNGSEEMEAVIMIDVLRRAGADVVVASVEDGLQVTCSRGVKLTADVSMADAAKDQYDLIAMPGGMPGAERLRDNAALESQVKGQMESGRLLAAICATPAVFLEERGCLLARRRLATLAFQRSSPTKAPVESRVVVDGKLTTSRGPGTAFEFALSLVNQLYGPEKMKAVADPMVMYPYSV